MADPLWINEAPGTGAPALTANELRQNMGLALQYGGRNVGARAGIRPGGTQLQVSLAGSTITVQPGLCCVDPGLSTPQGSYWVAIPVAETPGPLAAADATNPRKDIVIARVYDNDEDASGLRLARTEYLAGVPAASPSRPNVPSGAFRLATIDVPQSGGGAAVVTNDGPFTVAAGGLLPVRNQSERDAVATYNGAAVWRMDRKWIEAHDGTAWRVQGVAIVANVADLSAITHPVNGNLAWNTGENRLYRYSGAWLTLDGGAVAVQYSDSTAHSGITSTTYAPGTVDCGGTFVAPQSGRVSVLVGLNATGANPNRIYCSWEVRQTNAAGAVVVAATDANGILTDWAGGAQTGGMPTIVPGLTPGSTYYIRTMHRMIAGSGSIFVRRLTITPVA